MTNPLDRKIWAPDGDLFKTRSKLLSVARSIGKRDEIGQAAFDATLGVRVLAQMFSRPRNPAPESIVRQLENALVEVQASKDTVPESASMIQELTAAKEVFSKATVSVSDEDQDEAKDDDSSDESSED